MNAFLRQMAVLGILTTLAEHLLPDSGIRKAGRTVIGLLMMLTIVTSLLEIIKVPLPDIAGIARQQQKTELAVIKIPGSYRDTVLQSLKRQVEDAAQMAASKAGYNDIDAWAELSYDGEITSLWLTSQAEAVSAFSGGGIVQEDFQVLKEQVSKALSISDDVIFVKAGGTVP